MKKLANAAEATGAMASSDATGGGSVARNKRQVRMFDLVRAELVKGRRSFGRTCIFAFPLAIALMAIALMGGRFVQIGALNWWYVALLPAVVALICVNLVSPEKKHGFTGMFALPTSKARMWGAKVLAGCFYLTVANFILFGLTTLTGLAFSSQYPVYQGLFAALVLTITCAWQIPLGMFLACRFSPALTLISILVVDFICSGQPLAGGPLWFIPFSIPARLMAPLLGVNPNGVSLQAGDALLDPSVIAPGLAITAALFVIACMATSVWFSRKGD